MKQIEFDETLESLQKIFVLAEQIDIKVRCKQCGEMMTLILENDPLEKEGRIFPSPGIFCPNEHISMLWSPPPKSELDLFWEEFERRYHQKKDNEQTSRNIFTVASFTLN
jgi:hypothetical protein